MTHSARWSWLRLGSIGWLSCGLLVIWGAIGVYTTTMLAPLDHNEHMYLAAAVLWRDHAIYRDFAYLQTPYFAGFLRFALLFGDELHYAGRLLSALSTVSAGVILLLIVRRQTGSLLLAAAGFVLFITSPTTARLYEASNYALPIAFCLAAIYAQLRASLSPHPSLCSHWSDAQREGRTDRLWLAASGFFFSLAVGTKLYYAPLVLGHAVALLLPWPGARQLLARRALPWAVGALVGALPLLWIVVRSGGYFFFCTVGLFQVNAKWREATGYAQAMDLPGKLRYLRQLLSGPANIVVVGLMFAGLLIATRRFGERLDRVCSAGTTRALLALRPRLLLVVATMSTALWAVLVPTPLFPQYVGLPLPLMVLFGVLALGTYLPRLAPQLGLGIALTAALFAHTTTFAHCDQVTNKALFTPIRIHRAGRVFAAAMKQAGVAGEVATLAPLLALEAGATVYPELSAGPFVYRIFERFEKGTPIVGVGKTGIASLFARRPPAAVIVGGEGQLDRPLLDWAIRHRYRLASRQLVWQLYVAPRATGRRTP